MIKSEPIFFQMEKNEEYKLNTKDDYKKIAKSTYQSAVGFYIISQKCIDMILSEYSNQIVVNIAFACELFLKSILFEREIDCRKEHNLYKLYNLLPSDNKKVIKELHKSGNINKKSFELNLKEVGNSFVILRYSYEKKRLAYNLQFLIELLIALDEYCIGIFENKKVYKIVDGLK